MKKARLLACPGCARHVRVSEPSCVFCGVALPKSFGETPALPPPPRLSRSALYTYRARALAASTVALVTASCGGTVDTGSSSDGGSDAYSSGDSSYYGDSFGALYGIAPMPLGDASHGDEAIATMYGLPITDAGPFPRDASSAGDSEAGATSPDASGDAASEAEPLDAAHEVGAVALYGSPPRDASDLDITIAPAYGISPAYGLSP
jgi:hypothetical protein